MLMRHASIWDHVVGEKMETRKSDLSLAPQGPTKDTRALSGPFRAYYVGTCGARVSCWCSHDSRFGALGTVLFESFTAASRAFLQGMAYGALVLFKRI